MAQHDYIVESVGWISPPLADALRRLSPAPAVFHAGPAAYRPYADWLLGSRPGVGRSVNPPSQREKDG